MTDSEVRTTPRLDWQRVRGLASRLTTPLHPDDYLSLINPLWSARELRGRVEQVVPETEDSATLVIRPGWGWSFDHEAGQYIGIGVEVDGRQTNWQTPFVLVGNNEYVVDGIRLGSRARIDQGTLFLYLAPLARGSDLPALVARALIGRTTTSHAFEIAPTPELTIHTRTTRMIRVAIDGEVVQLTTPLRYRTRPGALHVLAPPP